MSKNFIDPNFEYLFSMILTVDEIQSAINEGVDINAISEDGASLLLEAVKDNNPEMVELLINNGANVNLESKDGMTPLMQLVDNYYNYGDDEDCIKISNLLINSKFNLNSINSLGQSPLLRAIEHKDNKMIELLIKNGVDINATNKFGDTLLLAAVKDNNPEMVELLIKNGADVNVSNGSGFSPLSIAVMKKNINIASILIKNAADITTCSETKDTPLSLAIQQKNIKLLELFLGNQNNFNLDDNNNCLVFLEAIRNGDIEIVKDLLENNNNLTNIIKPALSEAVLCNNVNIVEFLISKGATYDLKNYPVNSDFGNRLTREIAVKINHPFVEIIEAIDSHDSKSTFDLIKKAHASKLLVYSDHGSFLSFVSHSLGKDLKEVIQSTNQQADTIKYFNLLRVKHTFKNDNKDLILSTQTHGYEGSLYGSDIKQQCKTYINNKKIYMDSTGELLQGSTHSLCRDIMHYVIDKKGCLYVNTKVYNICHSYILRGTEGKTKLGDISLYGYGKPVASAGHLVARDGVITKINNDSGHYEPNADQLKIVCNYLKNQGVLADDAKVGYYGLNGEISALDFLKDVNAAEILGQYPSLTDDAL